MKQKIFIAGVWGFGNISIMQQFKQDRDVEFLENDFKYSLKIAKLWGVVNGILGGHGANFIKWILRTPLLDRYYALTNCNFDNNFENVVVIFNSALLHYYSKEFFVRLKRKHPSIKYILYIIDPMPDGLWKAIEDTISVFEKIITIHPYNCNRYGFEYLPYIYAKPKDFQKFGRMPEVDLFFCGVADDYRQKSVNKIIESCEINNVSFNIFLKPYGNDWIKNPNVYYSEMSYEENVCRVKAAKCILEIMHEGFVGITQRYLEAIVYNKKLLTNNAEIKELPYYNSGYIQYFENIEDIDWDWIKSDEKVDYYYKGEFEPERWKKNLLQLLEKGE